MPIEKEQRRKAPATPLGKTDPRTQEARPRITRIETGSWPIRIVGPPPRVQAPPRPEPGLTAETVGPAAAPQPMTPTPPPPPRRVRVARAPPDSRTTTAATSTRRSYAAVCGTRPASRTSSRPAIRPRGNRTASSTNSAPDSRACAQDPPPPRTPPPPIAGLGLTSPRRTITRPTTLARFAPVGRTPPAPAGPVYRDAASQTGAARHDDPTSSGPPVTLAAGRPNEAICSVGRLSNRRPTLITLADGTILSLLRLRGDRIRIRANHGPGPSPPPGSPSTTAQDSRPTP
ncbi:lysine-rich arabinogalactan protein 19-like [Osmia bicornis bicornis]|uniref:lysine-rich arabinogalactan protein 19-like n=1 Tax=Osmia bicornis bicornis TaxID=1437191 RepID=UPI001EAEBDDA|nr:lysine-rich arabinogalactan protein 19-like [Osmia bicornis bicornis]